MQRASGLVVVEHLLMIAQEQATWTLSPSRAQRRLPATWSRLRGWR
jgi:hypothetical protein